MGRGELEMVGFSRARLACLDGFSASIVELVSSACSSFGLSHGLSSAMFVTLCLCSSPCVSAAPFPTT